jgi:hypothetical protein
MSTACCPNNLCLPERCFSRCRVPSGGVRAVYPLYVPLSLKSQTRLCLRHATCPFKGRILQPGTHGGTTWVAPTVLEVATCVTFPGSKKPQSSSGSNGYTRSIWATARQCTIYGVSLFLIVSNFMHNP